MLKIEMEYTETCDITWYYENDELMGHGYIDPEDEKKFRIYACDCLWVINTDGTIERIISSPYMETTTKYYDFTVFKDDVNNDLERSIISIIEKTAKVLKINLEGAD